MTCSPVDLAFGARKCKLIEPEPEFKNRTQDIAAAIESAKHLDLWDPCLPPRSHSALPSAERSHLSAGVFMT